MSAAAGVLVAALAAWVPAVSEADAVSTMYAAAGVLVVSAATGCL